MPLGPEHRNKFDDLPEHWLKAVLEVLDRARMIRKNALDGQIVIVVKRGVPKWVRYEDNTPIDDAA